MDSTSIISQRPLKAPVQFLRKVNCHAWLKGWEGATTQWNFNVSSKLSFLRWNVVLDGHCLLGGYFNDFLAQSTDLQLSCQLPIQILTRTHPALLFRMNQGELSIIFQVQLNSLDLDTTSPGVRVRVALQSILVGIHSFE